MVRKRFKSLSLLNKALKRKIAKMKGEFPFLGWLDGWMDGWKDDGVVGDKLENESTPLCPGISW